MGRIKPLDPKHFVAQSSRGGLRALEWPRCTSDQQLHAGVGVQYAGDGGFCQSCELETGPSSDVKLPSSSLFTN